MHTATAMLRARDLVNTPPNLLGPEELAAAAEALAALHGARCTVVRARRWRRASRRWPPSARPARGRRGSRCWNGPTPAAPLVALCGKGVCFDTGGLDLKPASGMLRMKKDMGGAALVLGWREMVMRLGLPVRLLVLVGAVENAVAGNAFRPLDVLRTRAGLTVEVGNTDAEGRLVLADLLAFAAEREPALLVDCATLTGAARVALGPDLPAMMTGDDALAAALLEAGEGRTIRYGDCHYMQVTIPGSTVRSGHEQRGIPPNGGRHHRCVCSCVVSSRPLCGGFTSTSMPGTITPGRDGPRAARRRHSGRWRHHRVSVRWHTGAGPVTTTRCRGNFWVGRLSRLQDALPRL